MSTNPIELNTPADLRRLMRTDFEMTPQQWSAITAPLAPGVVIAGAGSGKTAVMAARVVYLVATGQVRPDQVLGLTFTRKAAAELRSRIRSSLLTAGVLAQPAAVEPQVSTYNSYASQLLDEYGVHVGHEPDTLVLADAARYQLAGRVVARHAGPIQHLWARMDEVVTALLALDGQMQEHLVNPAELAQFHRRARAKLLQAHTAEATREQREEGKPRKTHLRELERAILAIDRREELGELVAEYRQAKRELGWMDFADQIALGAQLTHRYRHVGQAERDKYAVVLLDEYQDTSVAQARLLRQLFSGPTPTEGRGHPVTAVGDPHQAIYGWRGASVSNILRFGQDFPTAAGSQKINRYQLSINMRSHREVVELANHLAQPLRQAQVSATAAPSQAGSRNLEDSSNSPGRAGAAVVAPLEPLPAVGAGQVDAIVHSTVAEEQDWLAELLPQLHEEQGIEWSEIAILTRDNKHANRLHQALALAGIPVETVGLSGLLHTPEVADIVATLRLLYDVGANDAMLQLLTSPRWMIGPRDLALLAQRARQLAGAEERPFFTRIEDELAYAVADTDPAQTVALSDAVEDLGELPFSISARQRLQQLAAQLRYLRQRAHSPIVEVVRKIIEIAGHDVELAAAADPTVAARLDNVDRFMAEVANFQSLDRTATLPALVAYLESATTYGDGLDAASSTGAGVQLLTAHRAKGLEWKVVIVAGVCESRFPVTRVKDSPWTTPGVLPYPLRGDAADLPQLPSYDYAGLSAFKAAAKEHLRIEELRLGYVAFTRAKQRLLVSSYLWDTTKRPLGPSQFQHAVAEYLGSQDRRPLQWLECPDNDEPNPYAATALQAPWPPPRLGAEVTHRRNARAVLQEVSDWYPDDRTPLEELSQADAELVAQWDTDMEHLVTEAQRVPENTHRVELPARLSVSQLLQLRQDPHRYAQQLARPMPLPPQRQAELGSQFHAWVERHLKEPELNIGHLDQRGDLEIVTETELEELIRLFQQSPYAERTPHATEVSLTLAIDDQTIPCQLDAIYRNDDGTWLIVDWKTNRRHTADTLQLALYRLAWARSQQVPVEQVDACFYYVRDGKEVRPSLPATDRELEQQVRELLATVAPKILS